MPTKEEVQRNLAILGGNKSTKSDNQYVTPFIGGEQVYVDVSNSQLDGYLKSSNQSGLDQFGNFLAQAGADILGGTIQGIGALGEIIKDPLTKSKSDFDNILLETGRNIKESSQEAFPIYRENPNKAWDIGDGGWWAQNAVSIASTLSLLIPAKATSSALSLAARSSGLSAKVSPLLRDFAKLGYEAAFMRNAENFMEAHDVVKQTKDDVRSTLDKMSDTEFENYKKTNTALEDDEKGLSREELADTIASKAGWKSYIINSSNIVFDVYQLMPLYKGYKVDTRMGIQGTRMAEAAAARKLTLGEKFLGSAGRFGKVALRQSTEGVEEMVNFMGNQEGNFYGKYLLNPSDPKVKSSNWQDRVVSYLQDPHAWEQGFWGMLGGIAFEKVGQPIANLTNTIMGNNPNTNKQARIEEITNRAVTAKMYTGLLKTVLDGKNPFNNTDITGDTEADVKSQKEDLIDTIKSDMITTMALNAARLGNIDNLLKQVDNGIIPDMLIKEGMITEEEKAKVTNHLRNEIESVEKTFKDNYSRLSNVQGSLAAKDLILSANSRIAVQSKRVERAKAKNLTKFLADKNNDAYYQSLSPEAKTQFDNFLEIESIQQAQESIKELILNQKDEYSKKLMTNRAKDTLAAFNKRLEEIAETTKEDELVIDTTKVDNRLVEKKATDMLYEYALNYQKDEYSTNLTQEGVEQHQSVIDSVRDEAINNLAKEVNEKVDNIDYNADIENQLKDIEEFIKTESNGKKDIINHKKLDINKIREVVNKEKEARSKREEKESVVTQNQEAEKVEQVEEGSGGIRENIVTPEGFTNRVFESNMQLEDENQIKPHISEEGYNYRVLSQKEIDAIKESGGVFPREGKQKGGNSNTKYWTKGNNKNWYGDKSNLETIRVKQDNFKKDEVVRAENVEVYNKETKKFEPLIKEQLLKETTPTTSNQSEIEVKKADIERRRQELESSREILTLYDLTQPIPEDSKEIISKIEEANKLREDAQAKSEQATKETNEDEIIALNSVADSLNEKAQILDKKVKTSRDSVINNTPIKQAITSTKILGQKLLNKIKLAAKSNEWVSSMPISKEEFTKLEDATKRLSVKDMGEVTSNSEVIPDILLIEEINAKYDAELKALKQEQAVEASPLPKGETNTPIENKSVDDSVLLAKYNKYKGKRIDIFPELVSAYPAVITAVINPNTPDDIINHYKKIHPELEEFIDWQVYKAKVDYGISKQQDSNELNHSEKEVENLISTNLENEYFEYAASSGFRDERSARINAINVGAANLIRPKSFKGIVGEVIQYNKSVSDILDLIKNSKAGTSIKFQVISNNKNKELNGKIGIYTSSNKLLGTFPEVELLSGELELSVNLASRIGDITEETYNHLLNYRKLINYNKKEAEVSLDFLVDSAFLQDAFAHQSLIRTYSEYIQHVAQLVLYNRKKTFNVEDIASNLDVWIQKTRTDLQNTYKIKSLIGNNPNTVISSNIDSLSAGSLVFARTLTPVNEKGEKDPDGKTKQIFNTPYDIFENEKNLFLAYAGNDGVLNFISENTPNFGKLEKGVNKNNSAAYYTIIQTLSGSYMPIMLRRGNIGFEYSDGIKGTGIDEDYIKESINYIANTLKEILNVDTRDSMNEILVDKLKPVIEIANGTVDVYAKTATKPDTALFMAYQGNKSKGGIKLLKRGDKYYIVQIENVEGKYVEKGSFHEEGTSEFTELLHKTIKSRNRTITHSLLNKNKKYTDKVTGENYDSYTDYLLKTGALVTNVGKVQDVDGNFLGNFTVIGDGNAELGAHYDAVITVNTSVTNKEVTNSKDYVIPKIDIGEKTVEEINKELSSVNSIQEFAVKFGLEDKYNTIFEVADVSGVKLDNQIIPPTKNENGIYTRSTNSFQLTTRWLNLDNNNKLEVLAHETLHGLVKSRIATMPQEDVDKFYSKLKDFVASLPVLSEKTNIQRVLEIIRENGKVEEVVTYGLTNPAFAKFLDSIESTNQDGEKETLWTRFKKIIREVILSFGYNQTKLDELNTILNDLLDGTNKSTKREVGNKITNDGEGTIGIENNTDKRETKKPDTDIEDLLPDFDFHEIDATNNNVEYSENPDELSLQEEEHTINAISYIIANLALNNPVEYAKMVEKGYVYINNYIQMSLMKYNRLKNLKGSQSKFVDKMIRVLDADTEKVLYNKIKRNIDKIYDIDIEDVESTVDANEWYKNWNDTTKFKTPNIKSVNKTIKLLISTTPKVDFNSLVFTENEKIKINKDGTVKLNLDTDTLSGIPDFINYEETYPKISQVLINSLSKEEMMEKLFSYGYFVDSSLLNVYNKLKKDINLQYALFTSLDRELSREIITLVKPNGSIENEIGNKAALPEFIVANEWNNSLAKTILGMGVEKSVLETKRKQLHSILLSKNPNNKLLPQLLSEVYTSLGINISTRAFTYLINKDGIDFKSNDNIISKTIFILQNTEKALTAVEKNEMIDGVSPEKYLQKTQSNNILGTAKKLYLFHNFKAESSYVDVNGEKNFNLKLPSFLSEWNKLKEHKDEFYASLVETVTNDSSYQYDSWTWGENIHTHTGKGKGFLKYESISSTDENGFKVIKKVPVGLDEEFVNSFNYSSMGGGKNESSVVGQTYAEIGTNDWNLYKFLHYFKQVENKNNDKIATVPLLTPSDGGTSVMFTGQFRNKLSQEDLSLLMSGKGRNLEIYNAIKNTVYQENERMKAAARFVFVKNDKGEFEVNKENVFDLLLHYHYKLDKKGNRIYLENGKPVGEVFKFKNTDYNVTENGKTTTKSIQDIGLTLSDIYDGTISANVGENIRLHIDSFIKNEIRDTNRRYANQKAFLKKELGQNADIPLMLSEFALNIYIQNVSQQNYLNGTTSFYKNFTEVLKRGKQVIANGNSNALTDESFTVLTISDIEIKGTVFEDIINTADGQSWITLEEFERRSNGFGQNKEFAYVLNKIKNNEKLNEEDIEKYKTLQSQKNFYYSFDYDAKLKMRVPVQIKNSEGVLHDDLVKDLQLEELYNFMKKYGINQINTSSAEKMGTKYVLKLTDENGNFKIPEEIEGISIGKALPKIVRTLQYKNLKKQQEVPSHIKDEENKLGSQIARKILDNIKDDVTYMIAGKPHLGKDVKSRYLNVLANNVEISGEELLQELGVNYNEKGEITSENVDISKLSELLLRDSESKDLNDNILYGLQLNEEGQFNIPLFFSNLSIKYENTISSLFTNNVVNQKHKGLHAAQLSNAFFRSKPEVINDSLPFAKGIEWTEEKLKSNSKRLEYTKIEKADGSVEYSEVLLPSWSKKFFINNERVNINDLPENIRTMVGYRIPTEAKYSMIIFKIVGFLPETSGSTIILPDDFVTQSGTDFDIDSIYTLTPHFYKTKDAEEKVNFNKVEFLDNENSELKDRYRIYEKEYYSLNKDKKNIKKYSIEDFEKLPLIKQNTRAARENLIFDIFVGILSDKEIFETEVKEGSQFSDITDAKEFVERLRNNNQLPTFSINPLTDGGQSIYRARVLDGRNLKGMSVNRDTFLSIAHQTKMKFTKGITIDYEYETIYHSMIGNSANGFKNEEGKLITAYAAQSTANILDNVKFPLPDAVNNFTFGVWRTLVDVGASWKYSTAFISQKVITDLSNKYFNSKSIFNNNDSTRIIDATRMDIVSNILNDMIEIQLMYDKSKINNLIKKYSSEEIKESDLLNKMTKEDRLDYERLKRGRERFSTHWYMTKRLKNGELTWDDVNVNKEKAYELLDSKDFNGYYDKFKPEETEMLPSLDAIAEELINYNKVFNVNSESPAKDRLQRYIERITKNTKDLQILEHFNTLQQKTSVIEKGISAFSTDRIKVGPTAENIKDTLESIYDDSVINELSIGNIPASAAIYPELFGESAETSVYMPLQSYYKYAFKNADKLMDNLFIGNTLAFRGFMDALKFKNTNTKKQAKKYLNAYILKDIPFFNGMDYNRIYGRNTKFDLNLDINDINNFDNFVSLSTANKLELIKKNFNENLMSKSKVDLLNYLSYNVTDTNKGYEVIEYISNFNENKLINDFRLLLNNDNIFIKDTAEDLIKYAYATNGLAFGGYSNIIPLDYMNDNEDIKINEYLQNKQKELNEVEFDANVMRDFILSNYKNINLVPAVTSVPFRDAAKNNLNVVLFTKEQWNDEHSNTKKSNIVKVKTKTGWNVYEITNKPDYNDELYKKASNDDFVAKFQKVGILLPFEFKYTSPMVDNLDNNIKTDSKILKFKNVFTVKPIQAADKKAIVKASVANKYIGFGEGIANSSTELYRQQILNQHGKKIPTIGDIVTINFEIDYKDVKVKAKVLALEINLDENISNKGFSVDLENIKTGKKYGVYVDTDGTISQFEGKNGLRIGTDSYIKEFNIDSQKEANIVNSGNYNSNDVVFVSIGGKRGDIILRKEQQDKTIKEALKAIEMGATLVTDNKNYVESSDYNEGEKRLATELKIKGYNYSEQTIDGQILGIWNKNQLNMFHELNSNTTELHELEYQIDTELHELEYQIDVLNNLFKQDPTQEQLKDKYKDC